MVAAGYRDVHALLRQELARLDAAALSWSPGPDMNPPAVLIVHLLGSEGEVWRVVAAAPTARDREAEFEPPTESTADLLARIDAADALIDALAPSIDEAALRAVRPRGELTPRPGLEWLLTNYGHAREHLAHLQLTAQLCAQAHSQPAG